MNKGGTKIKIEVTKHAITRYRERLFDYSSTRRQIENILSEAALQGKLIAMRLSSFGLCAELRYKGLYIVIKKNETEMVILTCLGDQSYRRWIKGQEPYFIKGRFLHSAIGMNKYFPKIVRKTKVF